MKSSTNRNVTVTSNLVYGIILILIIVLLIFILIQINSKAPEIVAVATLTSTETPYPADTPVSVDTPSPTYVSVKIATSNDRPVWNVEYSRDASTEDYGKSDQGCASFTFGIEDSEPIYNHARPSAGLQAML